MSKLHFPLYERFIIKSTDQKVGVPPVLTPEPLPVHPVQRQSRSADLLLLVGILLVAINLRPALASVGPLIEDIRRATGLSNSQLGLLTTLPLIAFGVISSLTPLFTRRLGIGGTLLMALVLLVMGTSMRAIAWLPALYVGTLLVGIAIAFGNVLMPSLTKRNFSSHSGFVTSLYSSAMALGASLAAGFSVPLAVEMNLGWRGALGVWSIPAMIALIVWLPQVRRLTRSEPNRSFQKAMKHLGGSALAWQVALFMGLQSLTFYVVLAWLPAILMSRGYDATYSGWMLSLSQAMGIFGSLIIPTLAGRTTDQRGIVLCLALIESVGLAGLLLDQTGWIALWASLIGFVLGGSFGLALLFIVLRSSGTETATELSGFAQSIGYMVAAVGPLLFGVLFDLTQSWTWSFLFLFAVGVIKLGMGWGAGSPQTLE
ncbi:CynX/NimT family MFS transporter [Thalassoglobus polymorphus]|uniref:Putative transporter YycB n=1 Tax=Thalassoglobus polymorphus TaxID=2527994 RepID=A0A517QMS2_9PLAN|nr:MFS transporter [Thalassoglobus polymorphus]QDT32923.1 putative transporter YycB [Thalassoglobus polymorphus]